MYSGKFNSRGGVLQRFGIDCRSKDEPVQEIYHLRLSSTLIVCLRVYDGVGSLKLAKSKLLRISGFPAFQVVSSSLRMQGNVILCSMDDLIQCNMQASDLDHLVALPLP